MRHEIKIKLEYFIDSFYDKFKTDNDRITLCAYGASQYINYLIAKGVILESEINEYQNVARLKIENNFGSYIPKFLIYNILEVMSSLKDYNYELISPFIKK